MPHKTLALVMAAGRGSRIEKYLEDDESTKAMVKIGDKRLIDIAIGQLEGLPVDVAVLSYPSQKYRSLDNHVHDLYPNARLMHQHVRHKNWPTTPEFLYVLLSQYFLSKDKDFLRSYGSILTLSVDMVLNNVNLGEMINLHYANKTPNSRQMTMLSTDPKPEIPTRIDLFKMDGPRIKSMKKYTEEGIEGYIPSTQAGIYILSREFLSNPLMLLGWFQLNTVLRYKTDGSWTDYGLPQNLLKVRQNP